MLHVKRTQGPKCLKERKRRQQGKTTHRRARHSRSAGHLYRPLPSENSGGDGHCGIYSAVDQLRQQGFNASSPSLRTDVAAFLIDKEYAWSHFPQNDVPDWALFVQQVAYTGPGGFFVNHTVFAAIACMYDCDLTIIQSMPDDTHACQLLSGKSLVLHLTNPHYDETVQWRKANVQGVIQPLFLAQRGMEHIMGTELLSS